MSLNSSELATLKAAMLADPNVQPIATQDQAVANYYNQPSSPAVAVWRPNVNKSEIIACCVVADIQGLTSIQLQGFQFYTASDTTDATSGNVRQAFSLIFSGKNTLTNLLAASQRTGTRSEVVFSSGGPPAVSTRFGYTLTDVDVFQARTS